jgi:hypothetical protein
MTFENQQKVQDAIDDYVEHFQEDDVTIFNMTFSDEVTRKFLEIIQQAINSNTRLQIDEFTERLGLDVPDGAII